MEHEHDFIRRPGRATVFGLVLCYAILGWCGVTHAEQLAAAPGSFHFDLALSSLSVSSRMTTTPFPRSLRVDSLRGRYQGARLALGLGRFSQLGAAEGLRGLGWGARYAGQYLDRNQLYGALIYRMWSAIGSCCRLNGRNGTWRLKFRLNGVVLAKHF